MLLTIGLDLPRMTLYLIKLSQLKMKNTIDPESIRQELQQYESRLISFRKTVHENPEVGFNTRGTLARIKSILEQFGISGLDTETSPGSGFLLIEGNRPGATVLLEPISMPSRSKKNPDANGLPKTEMPTHADTTATRLG